MSTTTERYLAYYTPLVQEFVREVEDLQHPEIRGMPQPHFPLFGKSYETSALRVVFIGQDTKGWCDLREFVAAERAKPGSKLRDVLNWFQDPRHEFTNWGPRRQSFWGFTRMMLGSLYGQEDWALLKAEVLDSFAWAEVHSVEFYNSSVANFGVPPKREYWETIRRAGERFNRFRHVAETLRPHAAVVLCRGMNPNTYFEGCRYEKISTEGRLTHYRLPDIGDKGVDVFHVPHPGSMNRIEGTDLFRAKLKDLFKRHKITTPFPEFLKGQKETEALEIMDYLQTRAPAPSPSFNKYVFVSWVAEELTKRGTFMSVPTLINLVNARGDKTNYNTEYSGLRGSYKLVSGSYHRMKKLGTPEGDAKAQNIAVAFRKPNFEYAYG